MADAKPTKGAQGLILTLGGAGAIPHSVNGLPGMYRPDRPTPVGGLGEPSLDQAKKADKDKGCPVELVDISASDLPGLRLQAEADRRAERGLQPRERK